MKRIIALLLVVAILCPLCFSSFAAPYTTETQRMKNEIEALEQYQLLLEGLSGEATTRSVSSDYYGGAYINSDGNLVVCVTDDYAASSNAIQTYTSNDGILLKTVTYTFDELSQEQDRITSQLVDCTAKSASSSLADSIRSTCIDEENNVLIVRIEDLSDEKINEFQTLFSNKDYIVFEEGHSITTTADWQPGRGIYTSSGSYASTGIPVYYTNSNGERERAFLTAGHAFSTGTTVYTPTDVALGGCIISRFSGSVDAALIKITNPSYNMSSTTCYGEVTLSDRGYVIPAQGTTIYKEGVTSGRTSGVVTSTSTTVYYTNATITDVLETTARNLSGDSGGVAYSASGHVIGCMSGSSFDGSSLTASTFTRSYICKYLNIVDAFAHIHCTVWE